MNISKPITRHDHTGIRRLKHCFAKAQVEGAISSNSVRDQECRLTYKSFFDVAKATVVGIGISAYTPSTTYIQSMLIPRANVDANKIGIRLNGDYDNGATTRDWFISAVIPSENDLIRTDISIMPPPAPGLKYLLKQDADRVSFWQSSQKGGTPLVVSATGQVVTTLFTMLWAEWRDTNHGTCGFTLAAIEERTGETIIEKAFDYRSFTSVTCAFVGEFQTAGNHQISPGINDWVIEELLNGYDAHVWDDGFDMASMSFGFYGDCNKFGEGATFDEICNAINNRGVNTVALAGYSHGGGSVYNQTWRMFFDGGTSNNWNYWYPPQAINRPYSLVFTGYLDAVTDSNSANFFAEDRRPLGSQYHTNQYQRLWFTTFRGTFSNGDEDHDRSYLGVGHSTFSTSPVVLNHHRLWYRARVER